MGMDRRHESFVWANVWTAPGMKQKFIFFLFHAQISVSSPPKGVPYPVPSHYVQSHLVT